MEEAQAYSRVNKSVKQAGSKDETEKVAKTKKKANKHLGMLEEGLVYSCAGPRIDPDEG